MIRTILWRRALAVLLLAALACTPGDLHGRVCLVLLGALEQPSCCPTVACCASDLPAEGELVARVDAGDLDCHCCVQLSLDSREGLVPTGSVTGAESLGLLPFTFVDLVAPPALDKHGSSRLSSRMRVRPRMAAPVPLRI